MISKSRCSITKNTSRCYAHSLGGLGRGQTQACVSNVTVHDVTIKNSQNGLRIKTWQVKGEMCSSKIKVLDATIKNEN